MEEKPDSYFPSIDEVITTLLDLETPLQKRKLTILSDLVGEDLSRFQQVWLSIPVERRLEILKSIKQLYDEDTLLSFETICRLALEDSSLQIRFTAIRSLQEYEVKDLVTTYINFLEEDENEEIRAIAATALGKYVYQGEIDELSGSKLEHIVSCLLLAARGGDTQLVRRRALESLGYSNHKEVSKLIEDAFASENELWLASALLAMGRTFDNSWDPTILNMLNHHCPEIRVEAIRAAGELEISESKPILLDYLEDKNSDIRMAAVWSLSKIGGDGLQGIFENLIETTDVDEEINLIEDALDNFIFNQSIGLYDHSDFDNGLE
jgi:hypothetical protein